MALAPRETGLHLRPHDSIGGVNNGVAPPPLVETARRREPVTDARRRPAGLLDELEWRGILHGDDTGIARPPGDRRPIAGYIGFDPSGAVAPHRSSRADLRAAPAAAVRRPAGRPRRRRDRDDRRSVGPLERAEPAGPRDARAQRRGDPRPARAVPRLLAGRARRGAGQQPRLARRAVGSSTSCATPASTSRSRTCWPRTRSRCGSSAACPSPSSATCSCRPTTSPTCTGRWASSCRWAARTSGATSPPASS